jgi:catechol 2,3-dioxygenase-like lactoylglutathione lyase family enzyme
MIEHRSADRAAVGRGSMRPCNLEAEMHDTAPRLNGVHHTAFPTWKPKSTVAFYRDVLGLQVKHAVTAKGWGPGAHPDFLHFFFDAGNGSTIAFFYYVGTEPRPELTGPRGYLGMARHTAWAAKSSEELAAWRARLQAHGVQVSAEIEHETIRSIYFRDPNGYPLEITLESRPLLPVDVRDAELTVEAMCETFGDHDTTATIEDMWRRKGEKVRRILDAAA